jgi:hypothetical protein
MSTYIPADQATIDSAPPISYCPTKLSTDFATEYSSDIATIISAITSTY